MRILVFFLLFFGSLFCIGGGLLILQQHQRRQLTSKRNKILRAAEKQPCSHRHLDPVTIGSGKPVSYICRECGTTVYDLPWLRGDTGDTGDTV